METKREQAIVGLFVLAATGVLLGTIFMLSGALSTVGNSFTASFRFGGGLEPGALVRYAGGPKVGRVEQLRIDPRDARRIEVTFSVRSDIPVKTDSTAKISYLGALSENYLEISPGSPGAPQARSGSRITSEEYVSFADIAAQINALGPEAQKLMASLNQRAEELRETVARVNDALNATNRANLSASLGEVRGALEENRPKLRATMANVENASAKFGPLLDDFKQAVADADRAVNRLDQILADNRPDARQAVADLRRTLAAAGDLAQQLDRTLNYNAESIDEMLENMRLTTQNLKQFTDRIKARPSALIRSSGPPDRRPGDAPKP